MAVIGISSGCVFFNDTATTEIYTLSLHDALPIWIHGDVHGARHPLPLLGAPRRGRRSEEHTSELQSRVDISYAVFCLKKSIETDAAQQAVGQVPRQPADHEGKQEDQGRREYIRNCVNDSTTPMIYPLSLHDALPI